MFQDKHKPTSIIAILLIILFIIQTVSAAPTVVDGEFRSFNGVNNNLSRLDTGTTFTQLLRLASSAYVDNVSEPRGGGIDSPPTLPSARLVSNAVSAQTGDVPNTAGASSMLWQWGQFIDHDLDLTESVDEPFPIIVPADDTQFNPPGIIGLNRSIHDSNTGITTPREQINEITTWIDASNVYGSDSGRAAWKRSFQDGRLKIHSSTHGELLPIDNVCAGGAPQCFGAGDIRAGEQAGLTSMHTLFLREHNRLATLIAADNPSFTDEEIFQRARAIVAAELQLITYNEFLTLLLGNNAIPAYNGYDDTVDPRISNEFSTAAFRVGHTMLNPMLLRFDGNGDEIPAGHLPLRDVFFDMDLILDDGIDPVLRGLMAQPAQQIDTLIVDDVRNFLFGRPGAGGFDLAALNIQRGRDHGLSSYGDTRNALGLPLLFSFDGVTSDPAVADAFTDVYGTVYEADLWIAGLAEDHVPGALVGETFHAILADQFTRLRDGDRFWYENIDWTGYGFAANPAIHANGTQLTAVTLADVIRWNTDVEPTADPFRIDTITPPTNSIPVLIAPADGVEEIDPGITFTWSDPSGIAGRTYTVFFDQGVKPAVTPICTNVTTTSCTYDEVISPKEIHYWHVEATDSNGTVTSEIFSFETGIWPDNPYVSAPHVIGMFGHEVRIPIGFTNNGQDVATGTFTLLYDAACLEIESADAVTFLTPSSYSPSVSLGSGQLDFTIADLTPPLTTLADGHIAEIAFTIICQPEQTTSQPHIDLDFTNVSFGGVGGESIEGYGADGVVVVQSVGPALSMPPALMAGSGETVTLPIAYTSNGAEISSVVFTLDYDGTCLSFDDSDPDGDGTPAGITLSVPNSFSAAAHYNNEGDLEVHIADFSNPLDALPDGVIGEMQVTTCSATPGDDVNAAVMIVNASYGSTMGVSIPGTTSGAMINVGASMVAGDCNMDGRTDAGDLSALVIEIFDGDGNAPVSTPLGDFAGHPLGCNANEDALIDAGDLSCMVLLMFDGPGACYGEPKTNGVTRSARKAREDGANLTALRLVAPDMVSPGETFTMPLRLVDSPGNITSFSVILDIDEEKLEFDGADSNGDGLPDGIMLNMPASYAPISAYDATDTDGEIDLGGFRPSPFGAPLADGELGVITLRLKEGAMSDATVRLLSPSLGDDAGRSVNVSAEDSTIMVMGSVPTAITLDSVMTTYASTWHWVTLFTIMIGLVGGTYLFTRQV